MKGLNKRAQFFLIAGLVVSSVILGFNAAENTLEAQRTETRTFDLSEEISYEAHQVIDNGIITGKKPEEVQASLEALVKAYGESNPDSDVQVLFGDPDAVPGAPNALRTIGYDAAQGKAAITPLTGEGTEKQEGITQKEEDGKKKVKVRMKVPDKDTKESKFVDREFEIEKGQNVYIVIKKKIEDEHEVSIRK